MRASNAVGIKSRDIWSITAERSRMINIRTVQYSLSTWASTEMRYKQTPPIHASVDFVYDRWCWKNTQKCN